MKRTTLDMLADRFFENMVLKNYSSATLKLRKMHMRRFNSWCDERGIEEATEVSRQIIERFHLYLLHSKRNGTELLSAKSQRSYLITVRMFFKFLVQKGYVAYNPANDIELPKIASIIPRVILSTEEIETIISKPDTTTLRGIRDRAILETLYSTGIRRIEIAHVCIFDVDFINRTLFVREGKGKKDRLVPIGKRALHWIKKYVEEVRQHYVVYPDSQILFLSDHGQGMTIEHYSRLVADYVKLADIGKKGSCHLFRHAMATMMHQNGADIRFVQQMLGHVDIRSTQIYTKVSINRLREIHSLTHPAEIEKEQENEPQPGEDL